MQSTLTPKPSDDPHDVVVVAPDAIRVAPADDELSSLLQQAARYRSEPQTRAAADFPAGPTVPPVDTTFRPASVNDVLIRGERRSMARRAVRAFIPLLLAACVGLAAVAWKSYGDVAKKKIAQVVTQFALTSSLPSEQSALAAEPAAAVDQADAANAPAQPALLAQSTAEAAAPAAAAPSADAAQSLQSMARDLASLGQEVGQLKASLEQLKANQQQTSRDVARPADARPADVRPAEPNLRPKLAALPPRPPAARARKPMPPSPLPQAAAVPALPPAAAPYPAPAPYYAQRQPDYAPRQFESQPAAETLADPELASVPRPPMPVR